MAIQNAIKFAVTILQLLIYLSSKAECASNCEISDFNINSVDLTYCNIQNLAVNTFGPSDDNEDLSKIQKIDLSSNFITVIKDLSFTRAVNLKFLILTDNELTTIEKSAFHELAHLEEISLNKNKLSVLDWNWFVENENLEILDVSENMLAKIDDTNNEHLPIQSLDLSDNYLENISTVRFLKELQTLILDNNPKMQFDKSTFKDNLELTLLSLENMNLKQSSNFNFLKNSPKLMKLHLRNNNLENIKLESLPTLPTLFVLSLRNCNLEKLDYESIRKVFPNLKEIDLMENRFECGYLEKMLSYLVVFKIDLNTKIFCKGYSFDQVNGIDCVKIKSNMIKISIIIIGAVVALVSVIGMTLLVDRCCFPKKASENNNVVARHAHDNNYFQKHSTDSTYESICSNVKTGSNRSGNRRPPPPIPN